ncbi:MAG: hypothetical protein ACE5J3_07380 [Methanosarcinales archaeon]
MHIKTKMVVGNLSVLHIITLLHLEAFVAATTTLRWNTFDSIELKQGSYNFTLTATLSGKKGGDKKK